ncbi:histidine--tRNA ligase isoform X2 [Hyalella azteca]|uniref:histidine--tRNA ligase n=1 Tax=Hyalella azteca TaxID=294128 RepID=A0A8B7NRK7_HYAAZ|nr:histidine--tRNA ligase isoform X2 [Hyalella azteca]
MDCKDLAVLDAVLSSQAFIFGSEATFADSLVYSALTDKLPNTPANVVRWAQHMAALSPQQRQALPQNTNLACGQTQIDGKLSLLLQKTSIDGHSISENSRNASSIPPTLSLSPKKCASPARPGQKSIGSNCKGTKLILKTPKGTRDYHPPEMTVRRKVFDKILDVFHMHGAVEIETPVFELKEVLTGKYGEDSKLIYDLEDQGGEILSLRYDLTVPFARYVAQNRIGNISRYHIARVYRRDNPAMTKGRYREFYQCDFDIAGSYDQMLPDAECVQVIHQVLSSLDLGDFVIKVNHRKLLDGVFGACGVPSDKFRPICSAVDKLDKSPWSEVRREMVDEKGLEADVADRIGEYVKLNGKQDMLDALKSDERLKNNEDAQAAIKELELLLHYTSLLECDASLLLDMSLARGLDYYTGVIYEAILKENQNGEDADSGPTSKKIKKKQEGEEEDEEGGAVGSVAGGGRYDNLVGMFDAKKRTVPCVGVSFGIERLFTIQERKIRQQGIKIRSSCTSVLVVGAGKGMLEPRLALCALLHKSGIRAETSRKMNPKFLGQLQHAEEHGIPVVVGVGESEVQEGVVNVRCTATRQETQVPRVQLVAHLQQLLPTLEKL